MTDPSILLRMLEPAVRPDGAKVSGAAPRPTPGGLPFEQTPFEKLLNDARGQADSAQRSDSATNPGHVEHAEAPATFKDPLAQLRDADRIENATLRQALASARNTTNTTTDDNDA